MGALAQSGKMYRIGLVSVGAPNAKERAGKIPIVVTNSGDPVATGLAASLTHLGGNLTGVSDVASGLSAKRLALLKEAMPDVRAVAVLWNADDLGMTLRYRAAEVDAKRLGMQIVPLGVHAPDDFDAAFAAMTEKPPDAILRVTDVLTLLNRERVIDFAAALRLPAIYEYAFLAHDGGLMAYGPNLDAIFDRAAGLANQVGSCVVADPSYALKILGRVEFSSAVTDLFRPNRYTLSCGTRAARLLPIALGGV